MKVCSAVICLDCDTLFESDYCPKCLSKSFQPLRKWLSPLHSFGDVKEEHYAKKRNLPIQEIKKDVVLSIDSCPVDLLFDSKDLDHFNQRFHSRNYGPIIRLNKEESSKPETGFSYHNGRIRVEPESSIKKGGKRTDASDAFFSKAFRILKGRFKMSSKEHSSGNCNPQVLSENQSHSESGVG